MTAGALAAGTLALFALCAPFAGAAPAFRDLNRNGKLDPYEDVRAPIETRVADLLARMTLEEKAGALVHSTAPGSGSYDFAALERLVLNQHVTSFLTRLSIPAREFAEQNNRLQELAARGRLGIPLTISTDPRNQFGSTFGASVEASGFSQWPDPVGLASTGDPRIVRRFADTARQEYRAVGIHMALAPQADLASEPRWPRVDGTFGEDPERVSKLVREFVIGFQHGERGPGRDAVATVVKHWVGYGAAPNGFDGHNFYGRFSIFPGNRFADHVQPFTAAFAVRVAGVMPMFNIPEGVRHDGVVIEAVGAGFNQPLLTGLLRGRHGFPGLILSDWAITNDCDMSCRTGNPPQQRGSIGTPWGVETLTPLERFVKGINAGLDQFGGVTGPTLLLEAVRSGRLTEARLNESVARVMELKFRLGLFDDPYVDAERAARIVGSPRFKAAALDAQRRSLVLLENRDRVLPLSRARKVFAPDMTADALRQAGFESASAAPQADVAILRIAAPYEVLHPDFFFGSIQHEGSLEFKPDSPELTRIRETSRHVPVIVVIRLDRPAILTDIRTHAHAIVAEFGATERALLDILSGKERPRGKLPFELPSSMEDVREQLPDVPHDTRSPLYPISYGLTY